MWPLGLEGWLGFTNLVGNPHGVWAKSYADNVRIASSRFGVSAISPYRSVA